MDRIRCLVVALSIGLPCISSADSSHCYNIRALDLWNQCLAGAGR